MSYDVSAFLPPGTRFDFGTLEERLRAVPGIGAVTRIDRQEERDNPEATAELRVAFPGWDMYVSLCRGETTAEEIEEILTEFIAAKPGLSRVRGATESVGIGVSDPPDDPDGVWIDFCLDTIGIIRGMSDCVVFDWAQGSFAFD